MKNIIDDRYEIINSIGQGGMANVYLANDVRLNRKVAIKLLKVDLLNDNESLVRFRKEALSAASLNNPHIVAVYDSGDDVTRGENGEIIHEPYIVMEYVEGDTIKDILKKRETLTVTQALEVTKEILQGLEVAHKHNIIHRDIKPANIMVTPNGEVKVMDFGIARALDSKTDTGLTKTSNVVGTATYFSPEQAQGFEIDQRADIYSAGVVFYEMLTGKPPFEGDSPVSIAMQHVSNDFVLPSKINKEIGSSVDAIISKMLAKKPEDRYSNASQVIQDIDKKLKLDSSETTEIETINTEKTAIMEVPEFTTTSNNQIEVEEDSNPNKKKIIIISSIIAGVVLLITLLIILLSCQGQSEQQIETTVTVPQLSSIAQLNKETACTVYLTTLTNPLDLTCTMITMPSDSVPKDMFISQSPVQNTIVPKGSSVTLVFSSGKEEIKIPSTKGMTQSEAREALVSAGFTVGDIQVEDSASVEKDKVTRTSPKSGQKVAKGEMITIFLSSGNVTIPDFQNMDGEEASASLRKMGIDVQTESSPSSKKEGIVLSQSPVAGSIPQGSTVTLVISVTDKIIIKDLKGRSSDYAMDALRDQGFTNVVIAYEANKDYGTGKVIRTNPVAGTAVKKTTKITIYVSTGVISPLKW